MSEIDFGATPRLGNLPTRLARTHPVTTFFALTFALSWTLWIGGAFAPDPLLATLAHYAGAFGPWAAAIAVVGLRGESVRAWLMGLFRWKVHARWYAFALGFPALLVAVASLGYMLAGNTLNWSLLPSRLLSYLPTLAFLAVVGGGNEEPGWRGFALGHLQSAYSPVAATALLGSVWALWHAPLLLANPDLLSGAMSAGAIAAVVGVTFVSIMVHAFWYTWLMNMTGSVLLCIVLHASYNTANGLLVLVPEEALTGGSYQILLVLMTTVLVSSVGLLLIATRGRLGAPA